MSSTSASAIVVRTRRRGGCRARAAVEGVGAAEVVDLEDPRRVGLAGLAEPMTALSRRTSTVTGVFLG
jgi:hypothetical protein